MVVFCFCGLHALARRFERGFDGSDEAVLRDLAVLARPERRERSEFDVAAPGGGRWRGSAMAFEGGKPCLMVRTFVGA